MKKLLILVILLQVNIWTEVHIWSGEKSIEEINQALNYDLFDVNGEINYKKIIEEYVGKREDQIKETNVFGKRNSYENLFGFYEKRDILHKNVLQRDEPKMFLGNLILDFNLLTTNDDFYRLEVLLYVKRIFNSDEQEIKKLTKGNPNEYYDNIVKFYMNTFNNMFGKNKNISESKSDLLKMMWNYGKYQIEFHYQPRKEYITIIIIDKTNGIVIDDDYKNELKKNVIKNRFGDVQLGSFLGKSNYYVIYNRIGNCAAQTAHAIAMYLGYDYSFYEMAYNMYNVRGTWDKVMIDYFSEGTTNYKFKEINSFNQIKQSIDKGIPVYFVSNTILGTLGNYREIRIKAQEKNRWERWIKNNQINHGFKYDSKSRHAQMITGYNEVSKEILISQYDGEYASYWIPMVFFNGVKSEIYSFVE